MIERWRHRASLKSAPSGAFFFVPAGSIGVFRTPHFGLSAKLNFLIKYATKKVDLTILFLSVKLCALQQTFLTLKPGNC
jgi:hypothetical protein